MSNKNWPSIKNPKPTSNKTDVYFDKFMQKFVPLVKKAKSKPTKSKKVKSNFQLKIRPS